MGSGDMSVNFGQWKLQDISITQILREIKFREFRSSQSAFANLGALNFVDSAKYKKNQNSEPPKVSKLQILHSENPQN